MHHIFDRLKQRKIVQWALTYVAGAGVLYSTLDGPLRIWGITDGQLKIVQVLLVVGFFLAVTLAWYHGERGEQRVTGVELLILAGIMGLGAIGVRLVGPGPVEPLGFGLGVDRLPNPFLPEDQSIFPRLGHFELSSDGRLLVYVHARGGRDRRLWIRNWDELVATPVRESEGGFRPTLSGDGSSLAYARSEEIFWLDLDGGPTNGPVAGAMIVNTGVWCMDLRRFPWFQLRWPGFEIRDSIEWSLDGVPMAFTEPEDWVSSRWLYKHKLPYFMTRELVLDHFGGKTYTNQGTWGHWNDICQPQPSIEEYRARFIAGAIAA